MHNFTFTSCSSSNLSVTTAMYYFLLYAAAAYVPSCNNILLRYIENTKIVNIFKYIITTTSRGTNCILTQKDKSVVRSCPWYMISHICIPCFMLSPQIFHFFLRSILEINIWNAFNTKFSISLAVKIWLMYGQVKLSAAVNCFIVLSYHHTVFFHVK